MRVRHELLHDGVEAARLCLAPCIDEFVERVRDDHLLPERSREVLALHGLEQVRRPQLERAQRALRLRRDGRRDEHAGASRLLGQPRLAAQPLRDIGIARQRQLEEPADRVPVAQNELDVVVALREQDRPHAVERRAQLVEHRLVAVGMTDAAHVARADAELVRVHRDAGHRDACAAEAAGERETRPEQAEHDDGAVSHAAHGNCASA